MCRAEPISFSLEDRHTAYDWMADTLRQFGYARCKRSDKGILRRYLRKVTELSRAQVARCIAEFLACGAIKDRRHPPAVPFVRSYTVEDIRLLAEMDVLQSHTLSGPATKKLRDVRSRYLAMYASSGWRVFRYRTCTTCAAADRT